MKILTIVLFVLVLSSCSQSPEDKKGKSSGYEYTAPAEANAVSEFCYLRTEGLQSQDSLQVKLLIKGNEVSGKLSYIPSEKDSRRGTLKGTKKGDIISATWVYMQEGITDSLPVEFRYTSERIYQRNAAKVTGYESSSSNAETERRYNKVACN